MSYGIFSHKIFKKTIAEMSTIIVNDGSRGSEELENVLFQKLDKTLLSLVLLGMASTDFDT